MAASPLLRRFVMALSGTLLLVGCASGDGSSTVRTDSASTATTRGSLSPDTTTTGACRTEPTGPSEFAYTEIAGVEPDLTSLDLYLPAGCEPAPVVVWVHGGGWRRGDKRFGTEVKAAMTHDMGVALVAVNYRLSEPDNDVKWPDHGDDVAAAIRWIQKEGPQHGLDPTRIALLGHSAGGHLVTIVVADPTLLEDVGTSPDTVSCVVALDSASFDLRGSPAELSGLVPNAFGTDPDVIANASPQVQVERNGAPTAGLLVVTRGSAVRVAGAQAFVDAVNDDAGTATLLLANPYTHNDVNRRLGETGEDVVTPPVRDFLEQCLAA